jgi:hypothetical protein
MSHTAVLEIEVRDLEALDKACQEVGAELVLDKKKFKCYAGQEDCQHAIRVLNGTDRTFEIGVLQETKDSYSLKTDFYGGGYGLEKVVGQNACLLFQAYDAQVFQKNLPFGWTVSRQVQTNGDVVMVGEHA